MPKQLEDVKIQEIINLYNSGISINDIADKTGSKRSTISKYLEKNNIVIRNRLNLSKEKQLEAYKLYLTKKMSIADLARKFDVEYQNMFRYINNFKNSIEETVEIEEDILLPTIARTSRNLTPELKQHFIDLYVIDGWSGEQIGKAYKCKAQTITELVKNAGHIIRGPQAKLTEIDKLDIVKLYQEGMSSPDIANKYNVSIRLIAKHLELANVIKRTASEAHRIYPIYEDYFDNIDTEDKAYFLGFMYADGCNQENCATLSLQLEDREILLKLVKLIYKEEPESHVVIADRTEGENRDRGVSCSFGINSQHICKQLTKWGCTPQKTFKLIFPEWLPKELHRHFIRGYFDGDGGVMAYQGRGCTFKLTSTLSFCQSVKQILIDNLDIHMFLDDSADNVYTIMNSGNRNTLLFLDWIYKDANLYLQRKFNYYQEIKNKVREIDIIAAKGTRGFSKDEILKTAHIDKSPVYLQNFQSNILTKKCIISLNEESKNKLSEEIFKYFRKLGWRYPDNILDLNIDYENIKSNINNSGLDICKYFCHSYFNISKKDNSTMLEIFNNDILLKEVILNMINLEEINFSSYTIMQAIHNFKSIPLGYLLNMKEVKNIYETYTDENDKILDYSAGFGERLLVAASCNRKYLGIDPLTAPELKKMKGYLGQKYFEFDECKILKAKSEDIKLEENLFDFSWSSPCLVSDHFCGHPFQAYFKKEYFYNTYWKQTLENAKYMLKPNKFFAVQFTKPCQKMLDQTILTFGDIAEEVKFENDIIYIFLNTKP